MKDKWHYQVLLLEHNVVFLCRTCMQWLVSASLYARDFFLFSQSVNSSSVTCTTFWFTAYITASCIQNPNNVSKHWFSKKKTYQTKTETIHKLKTVIVNVDHMLVFPSLCRLSRISYPDLPSYLSYSNSSSFHVRSKIGFFFLCFLI